MGRRVSTAAHNVSLLAPGLLATAFLLEVYIGSHATPWAGLRVFALAFALGIVLAATLSALLGRHRGVPAAIVLAAGLLAARGPAEILPFMALVPLLFLELRLSERGRLRLPWPKIHEAAVSVIVALLLVQVGRAVAIKAAGDPLAATPSSWATATFRAGSRPDIYLIIADAHGRQDVLLKDYNLDVTPFVDTLVEQGFDVATRSRSNYFLTRFSLASMLNGGQLSELGQDMAEPASDGLARNAVQNNAALSLLRRAGYESIVISSGYEHIALRSADRYIDTGQLNELESVMVSSTGVGKLLSAILPDYGLELIRMRTLAELDALTTVAGEPAGGQPRFVIAHLPVPHWPFVFDADCSSAPRSDLVEGGKYRHGGNAETQDLAVAQTICVERLLLAPLTRIVEDHPDAVVILMSDHGPEEHLDWWAPDATGINERSANLFAARTPGRPDVFPDDITLVNVLPRLFNAYLGTTLPLQPDDVWFGPSPQDGRFELVAP